MVWRVSEKNLRMSGTNCEGSVQVIEWTIVVVELVAVVGQSALCGQSPQELNVFYLGSAVFG